MVFDCDEAWESFCSNSHQQNNSTIIERNIEINTKIDIPKCSDLYISTTTKISYFDKNVDLFTTFWKIPIISYSSQCSGCVKKQMKYTFLNKESLEVIEDKLKEYEYYNIQKIS